MYKCSQHIYKLNCCIYIHLLCALLWCSAINVGFPSLGVLLQKLENPALRECLKVPSNEVCFIMYLTNLSKFFVSVSLLNSVPFGIGLSLTVILPVV